MARSLLFTNRKSQMCDCLTNDGIHRCRCDNRVNIHTIDIFLRVNPKIAVMRLSRDRVKNSEKKGMKRRKRMGILSKIISSRPAELHEGIFIRVRRSFLFAFLRL